MFRKLKGLPFIRVIDLVEHVRRQTGRPELMFPVEVVKDLVISNLPVNLTM